MTTGEGVQIEDPIQYLRENYAKNVFDETVEPAVVTKDGKPLATIKEGDSIIFFNFREDRAREITKAFVLPDFKEFERPYLKNLFFVSMVEYEKGLPTKVAFEPKGVSTPLGKVLAEKGLTQLRIAETEKFAHVTYFFNGGSEENYPNEDRVIVPSHKVDNYATDPQMSAGEITEKVLTAIEEEKYNFILINYANADMVGHTGNEAAATLAVEFLDTCLEKLISAVVGKNGCLLITADHGNAEEMQNAMTGETNTEHSTNPVPLWFVTGQNHKTEITHSDEIRVEGLLSDIAPTVLDILKIPKPDEMTGESLLPLLQ
jgi:2,3-bisphosphoglycerate-independent phosphoglycerate mutase